MTAWLILTAWIALNLGLATGALFIAHRRHGVQVLSARFLAETATVGAIFGVAVLVLNFFGVATGVG